MSNEKKTRQSQLRKKNLPNRLVNGLYIHSNPPRVLSMQPSEIRRWIRAGDLDKLENLILDGQGQKLLGEFSNDARVQDFLKTVPAYMARLDILHESVAKGRLWDVKVLLDDKEGPLFGKTARLALSKDREGLGLLHKAVKGGDLETIRWLIENYPRSINVRDKDRRAPLHFCGVSQDPQSTWRLMVQAGADTSALDVFAKSPTFYMHRPEQFDLQAQAQNLRKHPRQRQLRSRNVKSNMATQVKPANIRIWIHDQNLGKLKGILWEGQGDRLRTETSVNPTVRKFLAAVPYIMGIIKDVHHSTVHNDLQQLKKKTADPVPPEILLSKDSNGLNPLHKAAGLGFTEIVRYIVDRCPETVTRLDNEGRTPLHYAVIQKDGQQIFNILQNAGGDEKVFDRGGKTASYYKQKPQELDMKILQSIPSAPRNSSVFPAGWSWDFFTDANAEYSSSSDAQAQTLKYFDEVTSKFENERNGAEYIDDNSKETSPASNEIFRVPEDVRTLDKTIGQNGKVDTSDEDDFNLRISDDLNNNGIFEDFASKDKSLELQALEGLGNVSNALKSRNNHSKPDRDRAKNPKPSEDNINKIEGSNFQSNFKNDNDSSENSKAEDSSRILDLHNQIAKSLSSDKKSENHDGENANSRDRTKDIDKSNYAKLVNESEDSAYENGNGPINGGSLKNKIIALPGPEALDERNNDNTDKNNSKQESNNHLIETQNVDVGPNNSDGKGSSNNDKIGLNNHDELGSKNDEVEDANIDGSGKNQDSKLDIKDNQQTEDAMNSDLQDKGDDGDNSGKADELATEIKETKFNNYDENSGNGTVIPELDSEKIDREHSLNHENVEENKKVSNGGSSSDDETEAGHLLRVVDEELRENQVITDQVLKNVRRNQGKEIEDEGGKAGTGSDITKWSKDMFKDSGTPPAPPPPPPPPASTSENIVREFDNGVEKTGTRGDAEAEEIERASRLSKQHAQQLVEDGNIEQLAELVLQGQGVTLIGLQSNDARVNTFLEAVPSYLAKIEKVHKACMMGDLRGLQSALDRRKFASARDSESYFKPTPLHVAVLFERTPLIEYLAGRFPEETLNARDTKGRTALHYAATLPSDKIYNLLLSLGADPTLSDEEGYNPEQYLRNRNLLHHSHLMEIYRRQNAVQNKDSKSVAKKPPTPFPPIGNLQMFGPDDGRYLSQTVGGPLIKGLTEVVNARPENPVKYLGNFLVNYEESPDAEDDLQKERFEIVASTSRPAIMDSSHGKKKIPDNSETSPAPDAPPVSASQMMKSYFNPVVRDEFGQTMIHLAAARPHSRNAFYELLVELDSNIGYRDALYRTSRDIAVLAGRTENAVSIDKFVIHLIAKGETDKIRELMLEGYEHLLDLETDEPALKVASDRSHEHLITLLNYIKPFQEKRDVLHTAIRIADENKVEEIVKSNPADIDDLALAKNTQGRCSLHVALLAQAEDIVKFLVERFPQTLKVGDNLMRMPLHYAMALNKVEMISNVLIQAGAERVAKDLKGRQPSFYFMNKSDIIKLQGEERQLIELKEG